VPFLFFCRTDHVFQPRNHVAQGIGKRPHFVLALDIKGFIKIPLRNRCGKNNALAQRLENQHGYQKMHHQGRQHQGDNCGYGTGVQIGG